MNDVDAQMIDELMATFKQIGYRFEDQMNMEEGITSYEFYELVDNLGEYTDWCLSVKERRMSLLYEPDGDMWVLSLNPYRLNFVLKGNKLVMSDSYGFTSITFRKKKQKK
jgi:hypothetical protein